MDVAVGTSSQIGSRNAVIRHKAGWAPGLRPGMTAGTAIGGNSCSFGCVFFEVKAQSHSRLSNRLHKAPLCVRAGDEACSRRVCNVVPARQSATLPCGDCVVGATQGSPFARAEHYIHSFAECRALSFEYSALASRRGERFRSASCHIFRKSS